MTEREKLEQENDELRKKFIAMVAKDLKWMKPIGIIIIIIGLVSIIISIYRIAND